MEMAHIICSTEAISILQGRSGEHGSRNSPLSLMLNDRSEKRRNPEESIWSWSGISNPAAKTLEREKEEKKKKKKDVQSDTELGSGSSSLRKAKQLSLRWCWAAENDTQNRAVVEWNCHWCACVCKCIHSFIYGCACLRFLVFMYSCILKHEDICIGSVQMCVSALNFDSCAFRA